jgi:hypothetical protein
VYWTDSYLDEPYERYTKNPDAYPLGKGFDQGHDYTDWIKQMLNITFELNNRWRPEGPGTPVVDRATYNVELTAYKSRNQRIARMRQQYKRFRPCQKEVVDILLDKHDMDILGLKEGEVREVFSHEMDRFRTPEEIKANAAKRVKPAVI